MGNKGLLHNININNRLYGFLKLGIVFVAINLRPAITSIGPLIGTIRDDIGFSNWNVALLTALPLIAFVIMSPLAPKLASYFSNEWTLFTGLSLLAVGIGLRSIPTIFFLFTGTVCIGLGIAICNVLLPGVIKEKFPTRVAMMTSIYTTAMAIFAMIASGVSVPLADGLQLGWPLALLTWVIPAILGMVIWFSISRRSNKGPRQQVKPLDRQRNNKIWRSKLAWQIALFMGLQSLIYYAMVSWLAEILISYGLTKTTAGFMVSYYLFLSIPVSAIIPMIAVKFTSQSKLVFLINILCGIGILSLLFFPHSPVMLIVAVGLCGVATGSDFALALTFLSIRAKNAQDASNLSGMAQSVGYFFGALGPIVVGYINDLTKGWIAPLVFLFLITLAISYFGMRAGQDRYVFSPNAVNKG